MFFDSKSASGAHITQRLRIDVPAASNPQTLFVAARVSAIPVGASLTGLRLLIEHGGGGLPFGSDATVTGGDGKVLTSVSTVARLDSGFKGWVEVRMEPIGSGVQAASIELDLKVSAAEN